MTETIVLVKLEQSLTLGRIDRVDACLVPQAKNAVVLGVKLLEKVDRKVFIMLLGMLVAVFEKQGNPCIDDEKVGKIVAHSFGLAWRRDIKTEMVIPIGGGCA